MGALKGRASGNAGKGRPKGVPNKINRDIKEMVLAALNKAGGAEYLLEQSRANPSAFLTLVGKVMPLQLSGDADAPIKINIIKYDCDTGVPRDDSSYVGGEQAVSPAIIDAEPVPEPTVAPASTAVQPMLPPSSAPPPPVQDSVASMARHPPLTVVPNPNRDRWRI
jgi:hypothetical protein